MSQSEPAAVTSRRTLIQVPRTVWALGFVSMFMDTSSEMIHSLLPLFLVGTLGASASLVGVIEGIAEATASVTKVFSGWLSDRLAKRKLLTVLGYGLAAITKPVFALAITPFEVLAARFVDRIGKGIRGAPRDALVADVTPQALRGAAYGLRQALDTVGAFAGPLLAIGLMVLLSDDIRAVFAWAIVPAVIAVGFLLLGVREPAHLVQQKPAVPIRIGDLRHIGAAYWGVVIIGAVFTMARFSEAFLVLRASDVGLSMTWVPLIMVVMNLSYAVVAIPAGDLSDRIERRKILIPGLLALIAADLVLALWHTIAGAFLGSALWGLHMGLTQGLLAAMIADVAPAALRGTAFGVFNLICGIVLLAASSLAGVLWQTVGARSTFLAGAIFAGLSLLGLAAWRPTVRSG
jgi:MFS family permease